MSLEAFRSHRVIVLHPGTTAFQAARAMADNHIGAVMVAEKRALVGIITDRDIALAVAARGRNAKRTYLADIMTRDVASLDIRASSDEAAQVMRARRCRRVALLDGDEIVGVVTLDDLILHGLIDAAAARDVVQAQLEVGARLKPAGFLRPTTRATREAGRPLLASNRHNARAAFAYRRLLRVAQRYTDLDEQRAERALLVVLRLICERLTPEQARHFVVQLPSKLHEDLSMHFNGPCKSVDVQRVEGALCQELGLAEHLGRVVARGVCNAVADTISDGEVDAIRRQLPARMSELFPTYPTVTEDRGW